MNIIILNNKRGHSRTVHLPRRLPWLLFGLMVVVPMAFGMGGWYLMQYLDEPLFSDQAAQQWRLEVKRNKEEVGKLRQRTDEELRALTLRLADMQARLVRLDALGERLVDVAGIRSDEFDFGMGPAMGGPESREDGGDSYQAPAFSDALDDMVATLERREQQLDILESLLNNRHQERQAALAGRPISRGWMSSRYGYRTDPFNGKLAMHKGVDFAGKDGSDIVATASGVVTYSGERWGYGLMVEINHGNGLSTRYGHARELLVKPGDIVKPGAVIAKMGSSGRSTGPHVHYEVLRNGRQVNPQPYIYRPRH
ncbi:MAG: M23 family metallopeptidase [Alcanivoracaceae bacterium]|jgi:murein DD-endopeptidase MepM/ murein hydrolase activator NlpD|nr:M23 family metallopeptidase [Alcanivoracaceae bacterium]